MNLIYTLYYDFMRGLDVCFFLVIGHWPEKRKSHEYIEENVAALKVWNSQ